MSFSDILQEAKLELYEAFAKYSNYWWKEEDLQSYLYHALMKRIDEEKAVRRVHREYPMLYNEEEQEKQTISARRFGKLDLAILKQQRKEVSIYEEKIEHVIEMKFPKRIQNDGTILTTRNKKRKTFAKSFYKDYCKLWQSSEKVENMMDNITRHILFFEKFNKIKDSPLKENPVIGKGPKRPYQDIRNCLERWEDDAEEKLSDKKWDWIEFDEEKFDKTQFSYSEVYREEQESSPVLLHNWNGKPEINSLPR